MPEFKNQYLFTDINLNVQKWNNYESIKFLNMNLYFSDSLNIIQKKTESMKS